MNNKKHGKYIQIFIIIIFFKLFISVITTSCKEDEFHISDSCISVNKFIEDDQLNKDILESLEVIVTEKYKMIIKQLKLNEDEYILDGSKSNIKIPNNCLTSLVKKYSLDVKKLYLIIILNKLNNLLIYFAIKQEDKKTLLKSNKEHFFICDSEPIIYSNSFDIFTTKKIYNKDINYEKIILMTEKKIDLFNHTQAFFHDVCYKFSYNKTDLTLNERENLIFQNVSFCNIEGGAVYFGYTLDNISNLLTYKCAYGYFKSDDKKRNYIQNYNKINKYVKYNNKIVQCYQKIFKENSIIKNYGGIICFYILILQITFFVFFIVFGISILKEKLHLTPNTNKIISNKKDNLHVINNNTPNKKNDKKSIKKKKGKSKNKAPLNNFANAIVDEVATQPKPPKSNHKIILSKCDDENLQKEKKNANPPPLGKNSIKKKVKKLKSQNYAVNKYNFDYEKEEQEYEYDKNENNNGNDNKDHKIFVNNLMDNNKSNAQMKQLDNSNNPDLNVKKAMKIVKSLKNKQEKKNDIISSVSSSGKSQTNDNSKDHQDLNYLTFDEVKTNEKKNICQYFCFTFQNNRILLNLFRKKSDFNLTIIKISLILFFFPLCLTTTSILLNNKHMEEIHEYKKQNKIIKIHKNGTIISIYSSLICSIIMSLLKNFFINNNLINIDKKGERTIDDVFKCIKIRIYCYYAITLILLMFFFYYVTIFCVLFENTQLILFYFMIASWIWCFIYSIIICFVSALLRKISIEKDKSKLFKISKFLNLL